METEIYMPVCVLRRCGDIEGCKDARLPVYDEDGINEVPIIAIYVCDDEGNVVDEEHVTSMHNCWWRQISKERCAQFCDGTCLTRYSCYLGQEYCYPIPVQGKLPNKIVAVFFAWWCVDQAENSAAYAARTADAVIYAARTAIYAARAEDAAIYAARAADAAIYAARATDAADTASFIVDEFYLAASLEIEKLVNAWGTPVKGDE